MNPLHKTAPRVTTGLLLTTAFFILVACLGYHLAGSRSPCLLPMKPGGPEVRVELTRKSPRSLTLSGAGQISITGYSNAPGSRPIPIRAGKTCGKIRILPTATGLRLFLPGGPGTGESVPARLHFQGAGLRVSPGNDHVMGVVEVSKTASNKVRAIQILDMETYLLGVLIPEMGSRFPLEALKAQAVAARSYAYASILQAKKLGKTRVLSRSDLDQVFRPVDPIPRSIREAVVLTRGEVLGTAEQPLKAYYHSTCGGSTRDAAPHFDPGSPIKGRPCAFCSASKYFTWSRRYDTGELIRTLRSAGLPVTPPLHSINPVGVDPSGRIITLSIVHGSGKTSLKASKFRTLMNRRAKSQDRRILSTYMTSLAWTPNRKELLITGHGWGHGVGMCQMGAARLAREGMTYRQILAHYYHGISVSRAWGRSE